MPRTTPASCWRTRTRRRKPRRASTKPSPQIPNTPTPRTTPARRTTTSSSSADRWTKALQLTPDDFNSAKKVVQAHMALGNEGAAMKAREKVFALKKAAKDPQLVKLKTYVFDQFDVGKYHIYVNEAFDTSGDLAYVYTFQVTESDKIIGSINLETSAVIREQGVPFILGMDKGDKHTSFPEKTWKTQPAYKAVKTEVIAKIKAHF